MFRRIWSAKAGLTGIASRETERVGTATGRTTDGGFAAAGGNIIGFTATDGLLPFAKDVLLRKTGDLLGIKRSCPDRGEVEGEESSALLGTGLSASLFDSADSCLPPKFLGKPLGLAMAGQRLSSSPTSLVVLRFMSVGDWIGFDGFDGPDLDAVEPDRLTGTGTMAAKGNGDSEGDLEGRIVGSASASAACLFISVCFKTNL